VQAITVGTLHQDQVGVRDADRIPQDRRAHVPEVAAEDDLSTHPPLLQPEFDDRGAEDVAGVAEPDLQPRNDFCAAAVGEALELPHDGDALVGRVEGLDRFEAFPLPFAVDRVGLFLGEEPRVLEHDPAQVTGGALCINGPGKARLGQQRQTARMVDVGVAEDDGVQGRRIERPGLAVARLVLAGALDHAAVQQDPGVADGEDVARTGHLAGSTEKLEPHRQLLPRPEGVGGVSPSGWRRNARGLRSPRD
jgi:hypothetical protein